MGDESNLFGIFNKRPSTCIDTTHGSHSSPAKHLYELPKAITFTYIFIWLCNGAVRIDTTPPRVRCINLTGVNFNSKVVVDIDLRRLVYVFADSNESICVVR